MVEEEKYILTEQELRDLLEYKLAYYMSSISDEDIWVDPKRIDEELKEYTKI